MLSILLAVSTYCNPLSIPDMPVGIVCRDARNGDPIAEKGWRHDFWLRAACGFTQIRQFRELADPVVYAEGDTWYLYPSAGLMWTSTPLHVGWTAERSRLADRSVHNARRIRQEVVFERPQDAGHA